MTKEQIISAIVPILQEHGVTKAALFGSLARGDATDRSDVDLLVNFEEGRTLLDLIGLRQEAASLLGRDVDVVTYDSIHPRFRANVLREQEVIYEAVAADIS